MSWLGRAKANLDRSWKIGVVGKNNPKRRPLHSYVRGVADALNSSQKTSGIHLSWIRPLALRSIGLLRKAAPKYTNSNFKTCSDALSGERATFTCESQPSANADQRLVPAPLSKYDPRSRSRATRTPTLIVLFSIANSHHLMNRTSIQLRILLRTLGAICVLAIIPLVMPFKYLDAAHQFLGLGPFPREPIAIYLARSVSSLCTFYGGLLLVLSHNVTRYISIISYQAMAIMMLSAYGIVAGIRAGLPAFLVVADAVGCWVFLLPIFFLSRTVAQSQAC